MRYISTNRKTAPTTFYKAVLAGLAPDGGLFVPEHIPLPDVSAIRRFANMSLPEIAFVVAKPFMQPDFTDEEIKQIVDESLTMPVPLVQVDEKIWALELFHGPTLAFKDVGARFLARVLGRLAGREKKKIIILTATSGDTGGAVAHAFHRVPGVEVVILYPRGRISAMQERQIATLGANIWPVRINGTFDDCQRLVKDTFSGFEPGNVIVTSANSINLARWLPQSFYYFYAWSRLSGKAPVVFSVPSGNFGNLSAGVLAQKMGLPVQAWVAATNINDVVPEYLRTAMFSPRPSVPTISNAMDVGNPSNFSRLCYLYGESYEQLSQHLSGYAFTDNLTREAIAEVYRKYNYVLDPHTAIAYLGICTYRQKHPESEGVFLATAHPAKFPDVVQEATGKPVPLPELLAALSGKPVKSRDFEPSLSGLSEFIRELI
ncbi:MAG: threonine synthase [Cyclobacteriaceae bacterium]|nr:MAG: threonine synthase [Cyclobacteriaceae bacterium]